MTRQVAPGVVTIESVNSYRICHFDSEGCGDPEVGARARRRVVLQHGARRRCAARQVWGLLRTTTTDTIEYGRDPVPGEAARGHVRAERSGDWEWVASADDSGAARGARVLVGAWMMGWRAALVCLLTWARG